MIAAAHGRAVPADRPGPAGASTPGPTRGGRRNEPIVHKVEPILNVAVLPGPRGRLLRRLDRAWRSCSTAGRGRRTGRDDHAPEPLAPRDQRPGRWSLIFLTGDVRRDRLGDVARARLVLDDLRRDAHRRARSWRRSRSMIVVVVLLSPVEPMRRGRHARAAATTSGNLLLAFMMLWAYMSFSQYLIIWSGNLAEEIPWYLRRTRGGWEWRRPGADRLPLLPAVLRAAVPREQAAAASCCCAVASWILVMHWST